MDEKNPCSICTPLMTAKRLEESSKFVGASLRMAVSFQSRRGTRSRSGRRTRTSHSDLLISFFQNFNLPNLHNLSNFIPEIFQHLAYHISFVHISTLCAFFHAIKIHVSFWCAYHNHCDHSFQCHCDSSTQRNRQNKTFPKSLLLRLRDQNSATLQMPQDDTFHEQQFRSERAMEKLRLYTKNTQNYSIFTKQKMYRGGRVKSIKQVQLRAESPVQPSLLREDPAFSWW